MKQSVINTLERVGIEYKPLLGRTDKVKVSNRFGYGSCMTTPLIAHLIDCVYAISNEYEMGLHRVNVSDFDRIRYYILETDSNAYSTCID